MSSYFYFSFRSFDLIPSSLKDSSNVVGLLPIFTWMLCFYLRGEVLMFESWSLSIKGDSFFL